MVDNVLCHVGRDLLNILIGGFGIVWLQEVIHHLRNNANSIDKSTHDCMVNL